MSQKSSVAQGAEIVSQALMSDTDYSKSASRDAGSLGWRFADAENANVDRSASVTYQSRAARTEVTFEQTPSDLRGRATVDGALVATRNGFFATNRIDEGFAVIDVGVPGIDVLVANRKTATTNENGVALLPDLKSYQRNKISLDPTNLPADFAAPFIEAEVAPRGRAGVEVDLRAVRLTNSAVVVFRNPDGSPYPAGSSGIVKETGSSFIIGYDGRAFIQQLSDINTVTIQGDSKICETQFPFAVQPGRQIVIEAPLCNHNAERAVTQNFGPH